jgi:GDPmannose 4,6-dehydratase
MNDVVFITGGAGQDGILMTEKLLSEGLTVVLLMRPKDLKNGWVPPECRKGRVVVVGVSTLTKPHSSEFSARIAELLLRYRPFCFINFAGKSRPNYGDAATMLDCNLGLPSKILETIQKTGLDIKFVSCGSCYEMYLAKDEEHTIDTPIAPHGLYGLSKAACRVTCDFFRQSGVWASHCVMFNHESKVRGRDFFSRKVSDWLKDFKKNNNTIQLGNLDSRKDWSHAKDFIGLIWSVCRQKLARNYVFSSGETRTPRRLLMSLAQALDIDENDVMGRVVFDSSSGIVEPERAFVSAPSRCYEELAFKRQYSYNELITDLVS